MSASTRTSRIEFSTKCSSVDETVTLKCSYSCKISKSTRWIRWYKGTECVHQEVFIGTMSLTLRDVKVTDSGQYRCEAHGKRKKEVAIIYLHVADFKLVSNYDHLSSPQYFPGEDVTLSCHISPKKSAVAMEIRWFKEEDCICVYQNGQVTESKGYEGRVSLFTHELEEGNVSLILRNVQESDTGRYKCKIIHGKDKVENDGNWLHVKEFKLLTEWYGYRKHSRSESTDAQPYIFYTCAGVEVTLPCYLFPLMSAVAMEIRWFKGTDCICVYQNGQVREKKGYEGRVSLFTHELEEGNVSLMLRNVQKSDDGEYKCEVTRQKRKLGISTAYLHVSELQLITDPYSVLMRSRSKSSVAEPHNFYTHEVTLPCYLSAKVNAASMKISWFKETKCIFVHQNGKVRVCKGFKGRMSLLTEELQDGNVSLMLKNFQESDVGEYKCEVTHIHEVTHREHKMESSGLYLNMSEFSLVPRPEDVGHPSKSLSCIRVDLGDDVTLPCYLNPKKSAVSMEIRWFSQAFHHSGRRVCICEYQNGHVREGEDFEGRVSLFTDKLEEGNVSLMLKNFLEPFQQGWYTCEVTCGNVKHSCVHHLSILLRGGGCPYFTQLSDDEDTPETRTRKLSDPRDLRPIKPGRRWSNPLDFPNM